MSVRGFPSSLSPLRFARFKARPPLCVYHHQVNVSQTCKTRSSHNGCMPWFALTHRSRDFVEYSLGIVLESRARPIYYQEV